MSTNSRLSAEDTIARAIWGLRLIEPMQVILANDAHAIAKAALAALDEAGYMESGQEPEPAGYGYVYRASDIQG
ncbi:hypothetical protein MUN76_15160 [Leucobacter rhizosphaerae]|uniref:Uncharacterized protein n=1 Tax=Leucobacter rhizosphaerae TaxID=2932245 RepID=A0ABY4FVL4_9MICO|nr:hypothetical protein [Leucobacter rhizosphaerae]UOQ60348.1 hypothetical protein MUN76_15160 [Leucobacter rhizosphaerae]